MVIDLVSFTICYIVSYFLSNAGSYLISGILLCAEGIFLFLKNIRNERSFPDPKALFSFSWVFCMGISACKLSNLQGKWDSRTWLCFYLIFVCFFLVCGIIQKKLAGKKSGVSIPFRTCPADVIPVIVTLTVISTVCFLVEACVLGYVPLFTTGTPHAYSYFHISGIHYFTVLFVLEPSFFVYYGLHRTKSRRKDLAAVICTVICLILPLLLVSRFQLVFSILLACFSFILLKGFNAVRDLKKKDILLILSGMLLLVCCYVFLTVERAHSVEYLNGIFEMKDPHMPIFITQPYMYVANNFDNFNCLVEQLPEHTHGLRQLFPVFALTGLKFKFPELVNFPIYVTKEELTTVTMFYDAYYDFGIPGCVIFSSMLGLLYAFTDHLIHQVKTPGTAVCASILYSCLFLAFFTTWFSNPTIWFYLVVCIAIEFILWYFESYKYKERNQLS